MKSRADANTNRLVGDRRIEWMLWGIIAGSAAVLPVFASMTGMDSFRYPKELFFRAEGVLLLGIALSAPLLLPNVHLRLTLPKTTWALTGAILLWVSLTTLTSTNRALSLLSLLWVTCSIVIFAMTSWLARQRSINVVAIVLIPAVANSIVAISQALNLWNPMELNVKLQGRFSATALLGNPNDVGAYLVIPTVAAAAVCAVDRRLRWIYVSATFVLAGGLIVSSTLTAIAALLAGLLAMTVLLSRRYALVAILVILSLTFIVLHAYEPIKRRTRETVLWLAEGSFDKVLSSRMVSFAAAAEMFRDHPLMGVGPGCFGFQFFPYKIEVQQRYAPWLSSENPYTRLSINFAEVHNDHLEVLAETGLPGYAILIVALGMFAARSLPRRSDAGSRPPAGIGTLERRFSRLAAFPIAVSLFVLMLAQFPLQLAASTHSILYLAALCEAWSHDHHS